MKKEVKFSLELNSVTVGYIIGTLIFAVFFGYVAYKANQDAEAKELAKAQVVYQEYVKDLQADVDANARRLVFQVCVQNVNSYSKTLPLTEQDAWRNQAYVECKAQADGMP